MSTPEHEPLAPHNRLAGEMTFVEHLEELRWRIVKSLLALAVGFGLAFAYSKVLMAWLSVPAGDVDFIFTAPGEYFMASLKVAFFAGLYLALPVILYQLVAFVAPGLTPTERRWVLPVVAGSFLLFTVGGAFAYYALLPAGLHFLLGFAPTTVAPMLSIGTYLGFAASLLFAAGLVFELPLLLLALAWIGVLSSAILASFRKVAIVLALAIGAVITPSADIFSQLMLAGALVLLYELSVWLIRLTGK
ncbi:Sec-independent protein translocase protein TatC [compost metagenome]